MFGRTTRLRREYLYRMSLEGKERGLDEKKRKVRLSLEVGKPVPTELRNEVLHEEIDYDNELAGTHVDDEYANAAEKDPKILLTTSRDPSSRLTQFVKELKIVFPNAQRINRGGQVIADIVESCRNNDFTDLIIVHEHRGEPDGLIVCHLPFGPTAYFGLLNVVTRHDIKDKRTLGTMSEAYPHLILENFSSTHMQTPQPQHMQSIPSPSASQSTPCSSPQLSSSKEKTDHTLTPWNHCSTHQTSY